MATISREEYNRHRQAIKAAEERQNSEEANRYSREEILRRMRDLRSDWQSDIDRGADMSRVIGSAGGIEQTYGDYYQRRMDQLQRYLSMAGWNAMQGNANDVQGTYGAIRSANNFLEDMGTQLSSMPTAPATLPSQQEDEDPRLMERVRNWVAERRGNVDMPAWFENMGKVSSSYMERDLANESIVRDRLQNWGEWRSLKRAANQDQIEDWFAEREAQYADITSRPDFANNIAGWESQTGYAGGVTDNTPEAEAYYNYMYLPEEERDPEVEQRLRADYERAGRAIVDDARPLTDEQKQIYQYLLNTEGEDAAKDYYDYISYEINAQQMQDRMERTEAQTETAGGKVLSSIASIPTQFIGGAAGFGDTLKQGVRNFFGEYRPIDYNTAAQRIGNYSSAVRENTMEDMGGVGKFLYGTGMSMADSAFAQFITQGKGGVFLGMSAAQNAIQNAHERGASESEALTAGILSGAYEMVMEQVGFDHLMNLIGGGKFDSLRNIIKAVLSQGGSEAMEENATTIANTITDVIMFGDISEYQLGVAEFEAQGMSPEEAKRKGFWRWFGQLALDTLGGFVSGLFMGGGGTAYSAYNTGRNIQAHGQAQDVLDFTNEYGTDASKAIAQRAGSAENASAMQLGRMASVGGADAINPDGSFNMMEAVRRRIAERENATAQAETQPVAAAETAQETPAQAAEEVVEQAAKPAQTVSEAENTAQKTAPVARKIRAKDSKGASVEIVDAVMGQDSNIAFKTADGRTILADDLDTKGQPKTMRLVEAAGKLNEEGASGLVSNYDGGDVMPYVRAYSLVYERAQRNMSMDEAVQGVDLPKGAAQAAYTAGRVMRMADEGSQEERGGVIRSFTGTISKQKDNALKVLNDMFRAIGRTLVVTDTLDLVEADGTVRASGSNARFDPKTNRYTIALDAIDDAYINVAVHETVHDIKANSPADYDMLQEIVFEWLKANGKDVEKMRDAQRALAKGQDNAYYDEEIVANTVPEIFAERKTFRQFMNEFMSRDTFSDEHRRVFMELVDSVLEFIQNALDKLSQYRSWSQIKGLRQQHDMIAAVRDAYFAGLRNASLQEAQGEGETRESLVEIVGESGRNYGIGVYLDSTLLENLTEEERVEMVKEYLKELGGSTFTAYDSNGNEVAVHLVESKTRFRNAKGKSVPVNQHLAGYLKNPIKQEAITLIDELILSAKQGNPESAHHPHGWLDNNGRNDWDVWTTYILDKENAIWEAVLQIANSVNGEKILYEIHPIKKVERVGQPDTQSTTNSIASTNGFDNPESRNSAKDTAYLSAVESGDMETAQRMVDEAAKSWGAYLNNPEANAVFRQDGEVRTFYHGTNTGNFTSFDSRLLGSSSGDLGWFGKGFYFAFSHGEAATYGGRVIHAYLKMQNPFDYSQLYKFKGSDKGDSRYSRLAWLYNITKAFPDIVKGQRVWAYPNNAEEGTAISWEQLANWIDRIQKEKEFSVETVETNYGDVAYELRADPKTESFTTEDGETFEWTEYGMTQLFPTEEAANEPLNQIGAYLENVFGIDSIPRRSIEAIDFSGALQRAGYDGILQSMSGDEAVVFSPNQIKSADPVTYDDNGNVIPLSERFNPEQQDIRYSAKDTSVDVEVDVETELEQTRTKLAEVKKEKAKVQGQYTRHKNADERRKYRDRVTQTANELYQWLAKPNEKKHVPASMRATVVQLLRALDYESRAVTNEPKAPTHPGPNATDAQIRAYKARETVYQRRLEAYNDGQRKAQTGRSLLWAQRMEKLADDFIEAENSSDQQMLAYGMLLDPDLASDIKEFAKAYGDVPISSMDAAQLRNLSQLMGRVKKAVTDTNKMHGKNRGKQVSEVVEQTAKDFRTRRSMANSPIGKLLRSRLYLRQMDAVSFFHMLGDGATTIFDGLRSGFDKFITHVDEAIKASEAALKNVDVKRLNNIKQGIEIETADGKIMLTRAQIMSLYCLDKREHGRKHLYSNGGGIVSVRDNMQTVHAVTEAQVQAAIAKLSKAERKAADALQEFLSTRCTDWGNEATMEMYGYRKFGEEFYFPIKSVRTSYNESDQRQVGETAALSAIKNRGFTKPLNETATNPVVIDDILSVYSAHVADMAEYNAYLAPLADAMRWYNWRGSVQEGVAINLHQEWLRAFPDTVKAFGERKGKTAGNPVEEYFLDFIRRLNGGGSRTAETLPMVRFAKSAAVGLNLSVAIQQGASYSKAVALIDRKWLWRSGLTLRKNARLAEQYAPIAKWKSWGFFQSATGKNVESLLNGDTNLIRKARDKQGFLAEFGDRVTWARLWGACAAEQRALDPNRGAAYYKSEEFYQKVGARLSQIIDGTQVVDSIFHRSPVTENKVLSIVTAFMSETMKSYSMLAEAVYTYHADKSKENLKHLNRTKRGLFASQLAAAVLQAFVGAWRDKDEEKGDDWAEKLLIKAGLLKPTGKYTYGQKYMVRAVENVVGNMNPLNLHWLTAKLSDEIFSALSDWTPSSTLDTKVIESFGKLFKELKKDEEADTQKILWYTVEFASYLTGIGVQNVYRDLIETPIRRIMENKTGFTPNMDEVFYFGGEGEAIDESMAAVLAAETAKVQEDYPSYSEDKAEREARSNLRGDITREYKDGYVQAFIDGDTETLRQIQRFMTETGLYIDGNTPADACDNWLRSGLKTMYIEAATDEERQEIYDIMVEEKVYTVSELRDAIPNWTE